MEVPLDAPGVCIEVFNEPKVDRILKESSCVNPAVSVVGTDGAEYHYKRGNFSPAADAERLPAAAGQHPSAVRTEQDARLV